MSAVPDMPAASRGHRVDELRLELAFPSERLALDGQTRWESWLRERLLPIATEVFDEMSTPGEVWRLDALAVDLGAVRADTGSAELERRARTALREALARAMRVAQGRHERDGKVASFQGADLEALQRFLRHGTLPWQERQGLRDTVDTLVIRVLATRPHDFVQWLRDAVRRPGVITRLVRQSPQEALVRLFVAMLPGRHVFAVGLAGTLERLLSAPAVDRGRGESRRIAWEALLRTALARPPGDTDDGSFARAVLDQAARLREGQGDGASGTLRVITEMLRREPLPEPDPGGALRALKTAAAAEQGRITARQPRGDSDERVRQWRQCLERAVARGDAEPVRPLWSGLVRDHPGLVVAVVRLRGRRARVRRRMADGLPETMLRDIVHLLEPLHGDFIEEVVRRPDLLRLDPPPAPGPDAMRRRLWEFTLGFLLVERGGTFNRQDYLGSVLRQMAAHDNLEYGELLRGLVTLLASVAAPNPLQAEMLTLLRSLALRRPAPVSRAEIARGIAGADAYDSLAARVHRRSVPGARPEPIAEVLTRVREGHPAQWQRFVQELAAADARMAVSLARNLAAGDLRVLIAALVDAVPDGAGAGADTLLDAVHALVASPGFRERRALAEVLRQLATGQAIDLDAIVGSLPASRMEPWTRRTLRMRLESWLDDGAGEGIAPLWPTLMRASPSLVRAVVRERGREASVRHALAMRAPEPVLLDVVRLLAPQGAGFIEQTLRRPELFRPATGEPAVRTREIRRDLWLFTLGYLLAERGSAFNRRAYLGSVLRQQAAHENRDMRELVRSLLALLETAASHDPVQRELLLLLRDLAVQESVSAKRDFARKGPALHAAANDPRIHRSRTAQVRRQHDGGLPDLERVTRWLRGSASVSAAERVHLREAFERTLRDSPEALRAFLVRRLEERHAVHRLVSLLPEAMLTRVLVLLRPADAVAVLRHADVLSVSAVTVLAASAERVERGAPNVRADGSAHGPFRRTSPRIVAARAIARRKWRFLLEHLFVQGREFDAGRFARELVAWFRRPQGRPVTPMAEVVPSLLARLRTGPLDRDELDNIADALATLEVGGERALPALRDLATLTEAYDTGESRGESHVRATAGAAPGTDTIGTVPSGSGQQAGSPEAGGSDTPVSLAGDAQAMSSAQQVAKAMREAAAKVSASEVAMLDALLVTNAGQVLASPYLPRLFDMLGLLAEKKFVDTAASHRAVHVLQYLVDGTTDTPEHLLTLNKLLCGVPFEESVPREADLDDAARAAVDGLIRGMIQNWKAIGSTSVAGMRESFFQREGRLVREAEGWRLTVAPRAFDMLIDRIPWGFSIIRHPWMPAMLQVDWR